MYVCIGVWVCKCMDVCVLGCGCMSVQGCSQEKI